MDMQRNIIRILIRMRILLVISFFLTFFACIKTGAGTVIDNNVSISVLDSEGNDLLDPENPDHLDLAQIKVYYELNGVKTEINRSNLDAPKMFILIEPSAYMDLNYYSIGLFMNIEDKSSDITVTYLEWNPNRTDVFKSKLNRPKRSNASVFLSKAWLNDELICGGNEDTGLCRVTIIMDR